MSVVREYFGCADDVDFSTPALLSRNATRFLFADLICYGRTDSNARVSSSEIYDAFSDISISNGLVTLPFDPDEVITNLTHEIYMRNGRSPLLKLVSTLVRDTYYLLRPILPLSFRSLLQELYLSDWRKLTFPQWPVDTTADELAERFLFLSMKAAGIEIVPFIWFWPEGASGCAIMTHDVETESGRAFCSKLMDIDNQFGVPASFQVIPEHRYHVTREFLDEIKSRGYDLNVHDLNHDGRLYWKLKEFERRVVKINQYGKEFGAEGFRSGVLYRNQDWFHLLDFQYEMSVPNVAHLDPQRGGCCTVMPYFVGNLLEIPVTTAQDHSIFHILHDYSLTLWKQQIDKILMHHGLVSFLTHPDYIRHKRVLPVYKELLRELRRLQQERNVWLASPGEVNKWWRNRKAMRLKQNGSEWVIEGPESERARIAFACLKQDRISYKIPATA